MAIRRNTFSEVGTNSWGPKVLHSYSDLIDGLTQNPRKISSKYFYDARGSKLFEKITALDEYYITRCEAEILQGQSSSILSAMQIFPNEKLALIELGAGDGRKTVHLLKAAASDEIDFSYKPVDISEYAVRDLCQRLKSELPLLDCEPDTLDIETDLDQLPVQSDARNLLLYLGSSLGNFRPQEQIDFLQEVRSRLRKGDGMLIGFDLKKDPELLQLAYDDPQGVTKQFNYNLLERINKELNGNFQIENFKHLAVYNPQTAAMESWLTCLKDQDVYLKNIGFKFNLRAYESLHVETSWKFSEVDIIDLAHRCGFNKVRNFYDSRRWFVDSLWIITDED